MTRTFKNHGHFMRRLWFVVAGMSGAWHPGHYAMAEPQHGSQPAQSDAPVVLVTSESTDPQAVVESAAASESAAVSESSEGQDTPTNTDAFAQRHWHSGMAYLEEGEYAKALEAFTKAYELSERPSILRSIAVAHEKLGDLPSAIAAIDLYLRQVPDAADINDIRAYRAELQTRYDREQATLVTESETAPADTTKLRLPSRYVLPREQAVDEPVMAQTNTRTIVKWSALGVGLAAGASAALTGVMAKSEFNRLSGTCDTLCTRKQTHEGRTLALASTVLAGLAVVSGGAALFAWWGDDAERDDSAPASTSKHTSQPRHATSRHATPGLGWLHPHIDAEYANSRFMSYANWRF